MHALFYTDGKINLMRALFHPQGLRPFIVNWESFIDHLLQRLHRETLVEREGDKSTLLLNELMSYPDVAIIWQTANRNVQNTLLLNIHLQRDDLELKFFTTIATLGTPYDITLQELRIELQFPADAATERNWQNYLNSRSFSRTISEDV